MKTKSISHPSELQAGRQYAWNDTTWSYIGPTLSGTFAFASTADGQQRDFVEDEVRELKVGILPADIKARNASESAWNASTTAYKSGTTADHDHAAVLHRKAAADQKTALNAAATPVARADFDIIAKKHSLAQKEHEDLAKTGDQRIDAARREKLFIALEADDSGDDGGDDSLEAESSCDHMNKDGTFKNGFSGCVLHMKSCEGHSQESAEKICGSIAANKASTLKDVKALEAKRIADEKKISSRREKPAMKDFKSKPTPDKSLKAQDEGADDMSYEAAAANATEASTTANKTNTPEAHRKAAGMHRIACETAKLCPETEAHADGHSGRASKHDAAATALEACMEGRARKSKKGMQAQNGEKSSKELEATWSDAAREAAAAARKGAATDPDSKDMHQNLADTEGKRLSNPNMEDSDMAANLALSQAAHKASVKAFTTGEPMDHQAAAKLHNLAAGKWAETKKAGNDEDGHATNYSIHHTTSKQDHEDVLDGIKSVKGEKQRDSLVDFEPHEGGDYLSTKNAKGEKKPIEAEWSDAARAAAEEARKEKSGGGDKPGDLRAAGSKANELSKDAYMAHSRAEENGGAEDHADAAHAFRMARNAYQSAADAYGRNGDMENQKYHAGEAKDADDFMRQHLSKAASADTDLKDFHPAGFHNIEAPTMRAKNTKRVLDELHAISAQRMGEDDSLKAGLASSGYSLNDLQNAVRLAVADIESLNQPSDASDGKCCPCGPWVCDIVAPQHEAGETWDAVVNGADGKLYDVTFTVGPDASTVTIVGEPQEVTRTTDYEIVQGMAARVDLKGDAIEAGGPGSGRHPGDAEAKAGEASKAAEDADKEAKATDGKSYAERFPSIQKAYQAHVAAADAHAKAGAGHFESTPEGKEHSAKMVYHNNAARGWAHEAGLTAFKSKSGKAKGIEAGASNVEDHTFWTDKDGENNTQTTVASSATTDAKDASAKAQGANTAAAHTAAANAHRKACVAHYAAASAANGANDNQLMLDHQDAAKQHDEAAVLHDKAAQNCADNEKSAPDKVAEARALRRKGLEAGGPGSGRRGKSGFLLGAIATREAKDAGTDADKAASSPDVSSAKRNSLNQKAALLHNEAADVHREAKSDAVQNSDEHMATYHQNRADFHKSESARFSNIPNPYPVPKSMESEVNSRREKPADKNLETKSDGEPVQASARPMALDCSVASAADFKSFPSVAEGVLMYMPGGIHTITPSQGGKAVTVTLEIDAQTAKDLEAQRKYLTANNKKPFFSIQHETEIAAFWPTEFFWEKRLDATGSFVEGVWARGEWTKSGKEAVEGKDFRTFSPTFYVDAVRASESNPARVICNLDARANMGALENDPAFQEISPLWARSADARRDGKSIGTVQKLVRECHQVLVDDGQNPDMEAVCKALMSRHCIELSQREAAALLVD